MKHIYKYHDISLSKVQMNIYGLLNISKIAECRTSCCFLSFQIQSFLGSKQVCQSNEFLFVARVTNLYPLPPPYLASVLVKKVYMFLSYQFHFSHSIPQTELHCVKYTLYCQNLALVRVVYTECCPNVYKGWSPLVSRIFVVAFKIKILLMKMK